MTSKQPCTSIAHASSIVRCEAQRIIISRPPKGGGKRKAVADGTATPQSPVSIDRVRFRLEERSHGKIPQSLAEQFSYLHSPRPFKNPNYTKNVNRRAKNLKAVLAQERERERAERERRRSEKMEGNAMDVDGEEEEVPTCELTSHGRDSCPFV